jgi:CBS domain containing-hemolysin-like protein
MDLPLLALATATLAPVTSSTEPSWVGPITMLVLLSLGTLGISAFCSLAEATLLSLNPLWLKSRDAAVMPTAKAWLDLKQRIERPISAILVANTLANTGLPTIAGAIFLKLFGVQWLWAFSLSMTIAVVVFGELAPKIIAVKRAPELAPKLLLPLRLVMRIFGPVAALAQRFSDRFNSGPEKDRAGSPIMDIITLTQAAKAEDAIHGREEIIIIHAATLSARRVSASMTPADSVKVFHSGKSLRGNLASFNGFIPRACPVSDDGTLDTVRGFVRIRELLAAECLSEASFDWRDRILPVPVVGARDSLTHLLAEFLESDSVAALVRDKEGRNVGWVTMDDVTRILMGEG